MRKKVTVILIVVALIFAAVSIRIQLFPFGYKTSELAPGTVRLEHYRVSKNIPNTSIYSYKVPAVIYDTESFVAYLKSNAEIAEAGSYLDLPKYELGSFMDSGGNIDWQRVQQSVKVERILWRKVYSLSYRTLDPECNGYQLKMTKDGYILDYRSAGK